MTDKTWFEFVDEATVGDFVKFEDGDEKVIKIVTNPIGGKIDFKQEDGSIKSNDGLKMEVLVDSSPDIKEWTVTSKQLMNQLKAISVKEGMGPKIAGAIFRVNVAGSGMKRKYFVKLLQKPAQAAPVPASIPVSDADREAAFQARQGAQGVSQAQAQAQADPGQDWIAQQRAAAEKAGVR